MLEPTATEIRVSPSGKVPGCPSGSKEYHGAFTASEGRILSQDRFTAKAS